MITYILQVDSWNDVTMFNITKNSFTFHHVEEELKEHASYLVDSVADCIEEHILQIKEYKIWNRNLFRYLYANKHLNNIIMKINKKII